VITRKDGTIFRYTDHNVDVDYGGQTYVALNSQELSALEQKTDLSVDTLEFDVILNDSGISRDDVIAGLFDLADVQIYIINYETPADGVMQLISGHLGNANVMDDHLATIEFRSLAQKLNISIGRTYTHECDADLGDSRCGITLANWMETDGVVSSVTDNQNFFDDGRTEANDYFNYGLMTWTGGNNNGLTMEVKDYVLTGGFFQLVNPMPFTIQVGDTFQVHRGCDKSYTTCLTPFNNQINFRGFTRIPGMDKIQTIPDKNKDSGLHT
jgi:uncharacterized phage protein (TIGR02218 family)